MTRAELVQECIDRGWDYIASARIGTFVDHWYGRICSRHSWSFLEETISGKGPLEIADLKDILSVYDVTQEVEIKGMDRRTVLHYHPNLEEEGNAQVWYLEDKTLKTYPVSSSNELRIRYEKTAAKLGESDEPLISAEWQYLIVDGAVVNCLKDDDEYSEARNLEADVLRAVDTEMFPALVARNRQNPSSVVRTGSAGTYL